MKKVILITGVSSGIGRETAKRLVKNGYVVYGSLRNINEADKLKEIGVKFLAIDVTNDSSMVNGVNKIIENEGQIDVLINNAGYGSYGSVEDVPMQEARHQFEVNVFGMARLIQLALPQMRKQGSGKIINISSIAGKIGEPHGAWYHATKHAVEGLSDSLRMEIKQFGINVVLIEPGFIFTQWNTIARENLLKISGSTAYKNMVQKHVQMLADADKNASRPDVVANAIMKAIKSNNPKTRYVVGKGAYFVLMLRKVLSDKMFDKAVMSRIK